MASLDFPASPTNGQVFVGGNGVTYIWTGTLWLASGASAGGDFCANQTSAFPTLTNARTTLILTQVIAGNSGDWYSTSTGRYTPPAGRYRIEAGYSLQVNTTPQNCAVSIRKNGTQVQEGLDAGPSANYYANPNAAIIIDANGTDWFDVQGYSGASGGGTLIALYFQAFPISGVKGPPGDATPGTLIQTVSYQTGAAVNGTTLIPFDNTIPQITEGTEFFTLAITPKSATSMLLISVTWIGSNNVPNNMGVALFLDAVSNALATGLFTINVANSPAVISFNHVMTSGTTSPMTFRVRAGGSAAGTTTMNAGAYGGVMASSIVIQEVAT